MSVSSCAKCKDNSHPISQGCYNSKMRLCLLKLNNKNKVDLKSKMHVRLQQKNHEKEFEELSLFISVLFDLVFIKHQKIVLL